MTWEELLAHMDNLVAWGKDSIKGWTAQAAAVLTQNKIAGHAQTAMQIISDNKACVAQDLKHRAQVQNKLASSCVDMCKEIGAYPKCECPDFAPPDATPGVMTWDELLAHMDNLVAWGADMNKKAKARATGLVQQNRSHWAPQPCDELEPGVPCTKLYKHPAGSGTVMPCPGKTQTRPDGCAALFKGKADGEQCPQIYCPKALGKTMKLVCAGGCCPTCWAPDHVVAVDRHASIDNAKTVPVAPMAPKHCTEPGPAAKCFEPKCDEGFKKGFVQGDCCYSCVPGR